MKKRLLSLFSIVVLLGVFAAPWACCSPASELSILAINVTTNNDTSVTITWATDKDATSQVLYGETISYGTASPATAPDHMVAANLDKEHSITITGLTAGTTYHYQVKSTEATNVSGTSADRTFNTTALVISNVASAPKSNQATITWSTDDASSSQVEYGTTTTYGSTTTLNATEVTSHSILITKLTPNTIYHYRVLSTSATGEATSADATLTTKDPVTVTIGLTDTFPRSKNPFAPAISNTDYNAQVQVYEPLLAFTNNDTTSIPMLAESWDWDETAMTYTFHIDPRAEFNDGTGVTATDVKYSWDTMLDVVEKFTQAKAMIEDIVVVDAATVRFDLKDAYADFLMHIPNVLIVPEYIWSEVDDILTETNDDPVGSGAYFWTEYVTDSHCTYEYNPDYWAAVSEVDRVIHRYYGTAESMLLAYKKGDIDAMEGVTIESSIPSLVMDPNINVIIGAGAGNWIMELNLRKEPLNDLDFRQAMNIAIDRQAMIDTVLTGYGVIPQMVPISPSKGESNPDVKWPYELNTQEERIDLANDLLDEIPLMSDFVEGEIRTYDGDPLILEFYYSSYSKTVALVQPILDSLLDVGIKCNSNIMSYMTAFGEVHRHEGDPDKVMGWDMFYAYGANFYVEWAQPAPAPLAEGGVWQSRLFMSESAGWTNATTQAKLIAQETEMDPVARLALQMEIQEEFAAELPCIVLYHTTRVTTNRTDRFTGWIENTGIYDGDGIDYGDVQLSFVCTPFNTLNLKLIE